MGGERGGGAAPPRLAQKTAKQSWAGQRVKVNGRDPRDAELSKVELDNLKNNEWHGITRMLVYGVAENVTKSRSRRIRHSAATSPVHPPPPRTIFFLG